MTKNKIARLKNGQRSLTDSSPKMIYKWPINLGKYVNIFLKH